MLDKRQITLADCPEYALHARNYLLEKLVISDLCLCVRQRRMPPELFHARQRVIIAMVEIGVRPRHIELACNQTQAIVWTDSQGHGTVAFSDPHGIATPAASQIAVLMRELVVERDRRDRSAMVRTAKHYPQLWAVAERRLISAAMKGLGLYDPEIESAMGVPARAPRLPRAKAKETEQTSASASNNQQLSAV